MLPPSFLNGLELFQLNLLVLAVYATIVAFVFYKMWEDVSDFVSIEFDRAALTQQLASKHLQEVLDLQFQLADRYKPDQVSVLKLTTLNHSKTAPLYINWERSTLTNLQGESQRLIRVVPGGINLAQRQVSGVVAPARKLEETLTAEEALQQDATGRLVPGGALFSGAEINQAIAKQKPFTLRLVVELPGTATKPGPEYALLCHFYLKRTPLKRALYWD